MTWEVIARAFALKVVARKGQEISRKPMVKALMWVTPSIARWDFGGMSWMSWFSSFSWGEMGGGGKWIGRFGDVTGVLQPSKKL